MRQRKKFLFSFFALPILVALVTLTLGEVHASRAATALASVTDYALASGLDPWGTTFDSAGNVWVAIPGCNPTPDCGKRTPPGKFEVFNPTSSTWTKTIQLPSGYGQALFLAFDANGNLWFPMFHTNQLGEYDTTGNFHAWTMPTAASGPWDLVIDHTGMIWVTEHYTNKIAEFDPSTQSFRQEVVTQSASSQPYGITVDASNNIWFTENNSADTYIDEYTSQGQVERYTIRTGSASSLTPHMITVDPNGNVWWTEGFVGEIGELNLATAVPGTNSGVTEYTYPRLCGGCSTHASGIQVDSHGLVWFDDALQNTFGSFPDTGTGSFSMYTVPTSKSHPHDGLNVDSLNRIWFDEQYGEKVAEVVQA